MLVCCSLQTHGFPQPEMPLTPPLSCQVFLAREQQLVAELTLIRQELSQLLLRQAAAGSSLPSTPAAAAQLSVGSSPAAAVVPPAAASSSAASRPGSSAMPGQGAKGLLGCCKCCGVAEWKLQYRMPLFTDTAAPLYFNTKAGQPPSSPLVVNTSCDSCQWCCVLPLTNSQQTYCK